MGFNGPHQGTSQTGTIKWRWQDDGGSYHTFLIPDSLYVPDCQQRLLSPQHWARTQQTTFPDAQEVTTASSCILSWSRGQFTKTLPMDPVTKVADLPLAPGFSKYTSWHAARKHPVYCQLAHSVLESEVDNNMPIVGLPSK